MNQVRLIRPPFGSFDTWLSSSATAWYEKQRSGRKRRVDQTRWGRREPPPSITSLASSNRPAIEKAEHAQKPMTKEATKTDNPKYEIFIREECNSRHGLKLESRYSLGISPCVRVTLVQFSTQTASSVTFDETCELSGDTNGRCNFTPPSQPAPHFLMAVHNNLLTDFYAFSRA
jgi:hypothetical protein